ncbi:MAG: ribosome biogenesis GTPase YlqF [Clostridia bacterium]|nr:ribosome biogenesis GTPase YlqF [Clostridia bacterium]
MERKANNETQKSLSKVVINWYPGHMAKTKRQIIEDLKLVDLVVEILDARIPLASQNPDIQEYIKEKNKIVVINKCDLADEATTIAWVKYFEKNNIPAVITDANSGKGIRDVINKIQTVAKESQAKYAQKGRVGKNIRVLVLGIPNVGKSSFINRISKKTSAKVGNKPGVTRQKQWIKVEEGIELMDTPGVLWPKFENEKIAMNLAYAGTIKDDILEKTEIAFSLLKYLVNNYKQNLSERYKLDNKIDEIMNSSDDIDENDKYLSILDTIAKKRGAIMSGGRIDYEKVSVILLDEFRSGKIGKITLEQPVK